MNFAVQLISDPKKQGALKTSQKGDSNYMNLLVRRYSRFQQKGHNPNDANDQRAVFFVTALGKTADMIAKHCSQFDKIELDYEITTNAEKVVSFVATGMNFISSYNQNGQAPSNGNPNMTQGNVNQRPNNITQQYNQQMAPPPVNNMPNNNMQNQQMAQGNYNQAPQQPMTPPQPTQQFQNNAGQPMAPQQPVNGAIPNQGQAPANTNNGGFPW